MKVLFNMKLGFTLFELAPKRCPIRLVRLQLQIFVDLSKLLPVKLSLCIERI